MVGEVSSQLRPAKKPSLLLDLGWSAVTPLLFAAFALFVGASVEKPPPEQQIPLATQQEAVLLGLVCIGATTLVALAVILIRRKLRQQLFSLFYRDAGQLLWLNIWSSLGLPLWIAAIVLLSASAANWIDMGLAPVFTFALALTTPVKAERPKSPLSLLGVSFSFIAVVVVVTFMAMQAAAESKSFAISGVVLAVISSWGTVGASDVISKLQRRETLSEAQERDPMVIMFSRNLVALALLAAAFVWLTAQGQMAPHEQMMRIVSGEITPTYMMWVVLLWVLPNFLFIAFLKKRSLVFSAVMWASLPVSTTLLGFMSELWHRTFTHPVENASLAENFTRSFSATGVPWEALLIATTCLAISFVLLDFGQKAQIKRHNRTEAIATAPG